MCGLKGWNSAVLKASPLIFQNIFKTMKQLIRPVLLISSLMFVWCVTNGQVVTRAGKNFQTSFAELSCNFSPPHDSIFKNKFLPGTFTIEAEILPDALPR